MSDNPDNLIFNDAETIDNLSDSPMHNILVPTDFSEGAFHALEYAIELAKKYESTVNVVNAYSMPATGSTVMVDITEILQKNSEEALAKLQKKVEAAGLTSEVDITFRSSHGGVIQMIEQECRENKVDMVVMGTQGTGGFTENWLGSNTSSAAKNIEKPLWAIPAEGDFVMPRRILFTTDLKVMEDDGCLRFVNDLAERFDSSIKFLHVRQKGEEVNPEGYKELVHGVFTTKRPMFSFIEDDDIDEGIEEAVKRENPDLLITVQHDYGFFRGLFRSSVSRKIIQSAKLPVLVLRG